MTADFNVDTAQGSALVGYIEGMTSTISSRRYLDSATQFAFGKLAEQFGRDIDAYAATHKSLLHHVYEWGDDYASRYENVGLPTHRLWRLTSSGGGGRRRVSYNFLPSIKPVPVNPVLLVPGKRSGKTVREGVHVFTWKAPAMEYGITVTIQPELGDWIAFPRGGRAQFSQKTVTQDLGKGSQTGMFAAFFLKWWARDADATFDRDVRPRLESDTANEAGLHDALLKRRRSATIKFEVSDKQALVGAREEARRDYERFRARYVAGAADRRFDKYGD